MSLLNQAAVSPLEKGQCILWSPQVYFKVEIDLFNIYLLKDKNAPGIMITLIQ